MVWDIGGDVCIESTCRYPYVYPAYPDLPNQTPAWIHIPHLVTNIMAISLVPLTLYGAILAGRCHQRIISRTALSINVGTLLSKRQIYQPGTRIGYTNYSVDKYCPAYIVVCIWIVRLFLPRYAAQAISFSINHWFYACCTLLGNSCYSPSWEACTHGRTC